MNMKIYSLAIVLGAILGTWVGDWLYVLMLANSLLVFIIIDKLLEVKYGRN